MSNVSFNDVIPKPIEIVFSCAICSATIADISNGSDRDPAYGCSSKLWLANCAHAFCGKHLEGGGVYVLAWRKRTATNSLLVCLFIELVTLQKRSVPYASLKRTMHQSNNFMKFEAANQECITSRYLRIGSNHHPRSYMERCLALMP